jgi:hypothetical protein
MLDRFPRPRRLLLQWVPHAFGFHSVNLPFSIWLWNRASTHRDEVEVMIHEPYLPLPQVEIRHNALAITHRIMLAALLRSPKRVWVAIPAWEQCCRPYAFGRSIEFDWLPVVSNIPVDDRSDLKDAVRQRYAPSGQLLIGHFGTCGGEIGTALQSIVPGLLNGNPKLSFLLIGRESDHARRQLTQACPQLVDRIHATGNLSSKKVSSHISACDMMLQPYPDGVSSRRSSVMASLCHGKPIVTSSGRLTEPVWRDSDAVVLVPAGNHHQMISAAEKLVNDQREMTRLAAQARIMYDSRFCLESIVRQLRDRDSLAVEKG